MTRNSKKNIIMLLHGLGDNLLAFPALYDFYKERGERVSLVLLNNGSYDFWKNIIFVESIYVIKSNNRPRYWNTVAFFLKDYWHFKKLSKEIIEKNGVKKYNLRFLTINLLPNFLEKFLSVFFDRHKLTKIYRELGIKSINKFTKFKLDNFLKEKNQNKLEKFLLENKLENKLEKKNYIAIHRKSFYEKKNISKAQIERLAKEFPDKKFVLVMDAKMADDENRNEGGGLSLPNVFYTAKYGFNIIDIYYLIKNSSLNIVIDSSVMHLAQFVDTPTFALFKHKFDPKIIVPFASSIHYKKIWPPSEANEFLTLKQEIYATG
ncbi:MAG TPA: glycosyltransferase family 9 protein [Candidatus Paceibacterota bacterium]|nr:glycosyltransferase family 9 protein [Candidatus Paceibacterota bacterium]